MSDDKKKRPRGTGGLWQRGTIWWISYHVHGKNRQETTRTTNKTEAQRILRDKLAQVDQGKVAAGKPITLSEIISMVTTDRENNNRTAGKTGHAFRHVVRHLGSSTKARDITTSTVEMYKTKRLGEGAARASINVELSWLRRGLRLARRYGRLGIVPEISLLSGATIRKGFFEPEQFQSVARHLDNDNHRDFVTFLYMTGWRRGEGRNLEWRNIDRKEKVIRIEETKSRVPRTIPYEVIPGLSELIEKRWKARPKGAIAPRVFGDIEYSAFYRDWHKATKKAGQPGRIPHDFRRSAARNMLRKGVPQAVIMAVCGWKTASMFMRYAIADEQLIREGLAKLSALK